LGGGEATGGGSELVGEREERKRRIVWEMGAPGGVKRTNDGELAQEDEARRVGCGTSWLIGEACG
jgi:hypothetical protein